MDAELKKPKMSILKKTLIYMFSVLFILILLIISSVFTLEQSLIFQTVSFVFYCAFIALWIIIGVFFLKKSKIKGQDKRDQLYLLLSSFFLMISVLYIFHVIFIFLTPLGIEWFQSEFFEIVELVLWFSGAVLCFLIAFWFYFQYKNLEFLSKPLFFGVSVFWITFGLARLFENIRRYFIGTYNDVLNAWIAGNQITGVNFWLRFLYYLITWIGIAVMYWQLEKYVFINNKYFLTYCSIIEGTVSIINYFWFNLVTFWICVYLYFVAAYFASFFFVNLARKTPSGPIRNGCLLISLGQTLFAFSVMIDLPETGFFLYSLGINSPEILIRFTSPITLISGAIFFILGFKTVYLIKPTQDREHELEETKIQFGTLKTSLIDPLTKSRPDKISKEEVTYFKEQKICLVCKGKVAGFNVFICSGCDVLYCKRCARELSKLENACWACNRAIDPSKPVKLIKKEDGEIKSIDIHK